MIKLPYKALFSLLVILLTAQACFVAKDYERPEGLVDAALFRTDAVPQDSLSSATRSWRELFTDPILTAHIDSALANNLDIRIALQRILSAEAYLKQGKAGYLPSISVRGQITHQELSSNSQFGRLFDRIDQYELSGALSWEADIWGKIRSQKRAFEATYLQTVAAHQAVKTRLIANVANTYFQLLALDEQIAITETTIENRTNSLETTRALKEAGSLTEVGVQQTLAQLYTAQAILVDRKNQQRILENTFSILLGKAPGAIERSTLDQQQVPADLKTGTPMQLLENRPDVKAAEMAFINAFELTNVAKTNFYPSLTLTANSGFQSLQLNQLLTPQSIFLTAVGGLAQPIFNQRMIRTQYEVATANQQQALFNFRLSLLNAGKEVADALGNVQATDSITHIKERELAAYQKATQYSEELLNNGLANYLEVLTARENALNVQLVLIENKRARLSAVVSLYAALGGGWR
jgi:NodT family efflux transporter outer membrane factor (OMF) lipoprotein